LLCFAINYLQPGDAAGGTTLAGLWLTLCAAAAWAASNIVSRLAQQTSLMQCFALAGTNKKKRGFGFWQGANRSDTGWYGEDLEHSQGRKGAFLCAR
jgi:hypothetical protein